MPTASLLLSSHKRLTTQASHSLVPFGSQHQIRPLMSRFGALAITALLLAMALIAAPRSANALTCSDVYGSLLPCLGYLQGGSSVPSGDCCSGVRSLNAKAGTTADQQTACRCIKSVAGGASASSFDRANALPGKCGVSFPYKISPATDCSTIH